MLVCRTLNLESMYVIISEIQTLVTLNFYYISMQKSVKCKTQKITRCRIFKFINVI